MSRTLHLFYLSCFLLLAVCAGDLFAQNVQGIEKQKPFELRGSLSASLQFYAANGIATRRQPFTWFLSGAPMLKLYGITFPFSFTISEQERRFSQPFNQYGVSPYYKWIRLHLGYRNVRFSDYTLASANFLGAGIELNPKRFRLGFVYGQFARPVQEDSAVSDPRYRYLRPTFRRTGYAGKIGVGQQKAYLDFTFFKGRDIPGSIAAPSKRSLVKPMENAAAGLKAHLALAKNRIVLDLDAGASLLTRDIARYDIENPEPWQKTMLSLMAINATTAFFTAGTASVSYNFKSGAIRMAYQRVDPDYQSLGAYYFQNDVEQFTVSPSFSLLKNKVMVNGSYGRSHDNLNDKKAATTHRNIGALNITTTLVRNLNVSLNYSNFGVGQSRGVSDLFNDSLAVRVVNVSYGLNGSYSFGGKQQRQSVGLNTNYQVTDDQNRFSGQYSAASSLVAGVNYAYSFTPGRVTASVAASYVAIGTAGRKFVNLGPSMNLSKVWMKGLLRTSLNHNSQFRTGTEQGGLMANTGLQIAVNHKKQTLSMANNYLYNQSKTPGTGVAEFKEWRGTVSYGIRF